MRTDMQPDRILHTDDLTIGYDSDLISGIELNVAPGRIVTLIGPNGSGKSTLLRTLTGQLEARGGCVYLDGRDMSGMNVLDRARDMSVVMTSSVRPRMMTCREVVAMGRYPYTGRFGKLRKADEKIVDHALELTGSAEVSDRFFDRISDGQRQRVMLARAICQQPRVLILDEPTSYLDIRYRLDILNTIRTIADRDSVAVVMSLHELEPAMRISDTVVAIGDGHILRTGTPQEVFEESFIRRLYGIEGRDISLLGPGPWMEGERTVPVGQDASDIHGTGARAIMIQGTMSGAGKSMIAAGLCRIFAQDGYSVAPFKSQNMALNSYVTSEGLEMGRAQVMQARCCKREPLVCMNPILLKPTDDSGSQVIVNGIPVGNMRAAEYFRYKQQLVPEIQAAYDKLAGMADIIVIEGAGSPVELNLKKNDIVNMGLARMTDAAVLLVGDIDRGGVFAQLIGTLDLLEPDERARIKGLIVNKFRGDIGLFKDGIEILEKKGHKPVMGVVPYLDIRLEDEDSLSDRFSARTKRDFDICVIRFPRISNFTDMDVFEQVPDLSVRYVDDPDDVGDPDILILPGTKNTGGDLEWMKQQGLDAAVISYARAGGVVIGICGGYQMLGMRISDPDGVESGATVCGIGLLPVATVMNREKTRTEYIGYIPAWKGVLEDMNGMQVTGYEIHNGVTALVGRELFDTEYGDCVPVPDADPSECVYAPDGTGCNRGNIYGTYIHGIFDEEGVAPRLISLIAAHRGKNIDVSMMRGHFDESEDMYDKLAEHLRACLDIDAIYGMMGIVRP
ncbi:adenosylcobyric acid synthase (glutamine-hydrolysing) [Lachnospiraceae bacterium XBB2008]|nr:adenosylcobyric acid synthase (glutamine-hydrolysing) [Lachnospiraceae bacterium XBB2008]